LSYPADRQTKKGKSITPIGEGYQWWLLFSHAHTIQQRKCDITRRKHMRIRNSVQGLPI